MIEGVAVVLQLSFHKLACLSPLLILTSTNSKDIRLSVQISASKHFVLACMMKDLIDFCFFLCCCFL